MYRLHGRVRSRALRTLWLLEELGEPFAFVPTDPRSPEAFALGPRGVVPILETQEGPILDSVAQMTFLADRHGGFTHPAGTYARGVQDAATNTVLETFDAVLWALARHGVASPEGARAEAVEDGLRGQFARHADDMATLLGDGPNLAGDLPTVPDVLLAHCCGWARGLKLDLPAPLTAHMRRMRARPAFRRAMAHEPRPG
jgi:glutathione S-transferase